MSQSDIAGKQRTRSCHDQRDKTLVSPGQLNVICQPVPRLDQIAGRVFASDVSTKAPRSSLQISRNDESLFIFGQNASWLSRHKGFPDVPAPPAPPVIAPPLPPKPAPPPPAAPPPRPPEEIVPADPAAPPSRPPEEIVPADPAAPPPRPPITPPPPDPPVPCPPRLVAPPDPASGSTPPLPPMVELAPLSLERTPDAASCFDAASASPSTRAEGCPPMLVRPQPMPPGPSASRVRMNHSVPRTCADQGEDASVVGPNVEGGGRHQKRKAVDISMAGVVSTASTV